MTEAAFPSWREAAELGTTRVLAWMRKLPERVRLSPDEARTVVQTALWQAERRGAVLNPGYVVQRARGAVIDEIRRQHAESQSSTGGRSRWAAHAHLDVNDCEEAPELSREPEQEQRLAAAEREEYARRVLDALSPRERFVLEARYLHGLRGIDIAAALGVAGPRVSQIHRRALERAAEAPMDLNLPRALARLEDELVRRALERTGGNRTQAAKLLGIRRTTLVELLKRKAAGTADRLRRRYPAPRVRAA